MAAGLDRFLAVDANISIHQFPPLGNQDLALNDIDTRDNFRDRMLNLKPGVNLDEEERACVFINEKFNCAGIFISDSLANCQCCVTDRLTEAGLERLAGAISMTFWCRPGSSNHVHEGEPGVHDDRPEVVPRYACDGRTSR